MMEDSAYAKLVTFCLLEFGAFFGTNAEDSTAIISGPQHTQQGLTVCRET